MLIRLQEHISMTFESKYNNFVITMWILKCCLQNGSHFVSTSKLTAPSFIPVIANDLGGLSLTWINFNLSLGKWYHPLKVWDEITYLFPNFNGYTVEVWEWDT